MNRRKLPRVIILGILVLALSTFSRANTQTQEPQPPQTAVPAVRFTSGKSALKIPLEIDNNIILLRVSVNGSRPLKFIFDTGASHSVIVSQRTQELGLKTEGEATGTATGGPVQGSFITGVSLSVLGAEVSNQLLASFPFPAVPGFEFDGVIGYDFIKQFVVEIDYPNKLMNLYDPRTYAYRGKEKAIPLLFDGGRIPFVLTKIVVDGRAPFEAKLEVDTGADGTFLLDTPLVKRHQLVAAMPKAVQDRGRGAGGEERRLLGQVKAVHLGRFILKDPPLALSQHTEDAREGEDQDGLVGGEIFRRFKVILDYRHRRMILEPNKSFNDPYQLEVGG
jgi:hypothetical protein